MRSMDIPLSSLVHDAPEQGVFSCSSALYTDEEVFAAEMQQLFFGGWVFLGLEAEVQVPHAYRTLKIGEVSLLLMRDGQGQLRCFHNRCGHRGAQLCDTPCGTRPVHICRYHGWSYQSDGHLKGAPACEAGCYTPGAAPTAGRLQEIARLQCHAGFIFGSLQSNVEPLEEFLGEATRYLDLFAQMSPDGLEVIPGPVTFTYRGNWKLLADNTLDYYHFAAVHGSLVQVFSGRQGQPSSVPPCEPWEETSDEVNGTATTPQGHAMMYAIRAPIRELPKPLRFDAQAMRRISAEHGEGTLRWMLRQRNVVIFPNLQLIDASALQVRVLRPLEAGLTEVTTYSIAPRGEPRDVRVRRVANYNEFFGPGGLGQPDDSMVFERVQAGVRSFSPLSLQGFGRGMALNATDTLLARELGIAESNIRSGSLGLGDESGPRAFYRAWLVRMQRG